MSSSLGISLGRSKLRKRQVVNAYPRNPVIATRTAAIQRSPVGMKATNATADARRMVQSAASGNIHFTLQVSTPTKAAPNANPATRAGMSINRSIEKAIQA